MKTLLCAALLASVPAGAQTLRSSRAELFLGEEPGGSELVYGPGAGGPLTLENLGAEPVLLLPTLQAPGEGRLRDGYEPLPDLSWAELSGSSPRVLPGSSTGVTIRVRLPRDARLDEGQFQFDVLLQAREPRGGAAQLRTAALLAVGEGDPRPIPLEPAGSTFVVTPARGRLDSFPLGRRAPARSGGFRGLKLANAGSGPLSVRARAVRDWGAKVRLETGWTPAPNPRWLKAGAPVRVAAGAVAELPLELEIPDQPRYRGRRWVFRVAVDAESEGRARRTWWHLYVRTAEAPR